MLNLLKQASSVTYTANGALTHSTSGASCLDLLFRAGAMRMTSPEEIAYAKEVVEAIEDAEKNGRGVAAVRGKMVDKPVVLRARQTLSLAEQMKGASL